MLAPTPPQSLFLFACGLSSLSVSLKSEKAFITSSLSLSICLFVELCGTFLFGSRQYHLYFLFLFILVVNLCTLCHCRSLIRFFGYFVIFCFHTRMLPCCVPVLFSFYCRPICQLSSCSHDSHTPCHRKGKLAHVCNTQKQQQKQTNKQKDAG